jgi:hypothetical protein
MAAAARWLPPSPASWHSVPTAMALEHAQHYTHLALRDAYAIAEGQRIPLR